MLPRRSSCSVLFEGWKRLNSWTDINTPAPSARLELYRRIDQSRAARFLDETIVNDEYWKRVSRTDEFIAVFTVCEAVSECFESDGVVFSEEKPIC